MNRPGVPTTGLRLAKCPENQRVECEVIATDGLRSYGVALARLRPGERHRRGRLRDDNRVEKSHLSIRRRDRKMQGFESQKSAQRFLKTHAAIYNTFNIQIHPPNCGATRVLRACSGSVWSRAIA